MTSAKLAATGAFARHQPPPGRTPIGGCRPSCRGEPVTQLTTQPGQRCDITVRAECCDHDPRHDFARVARSNAVTSSSQ